MKVLTLDIETSPNLAHVWGLWDQNIGLPQLLDSGEVICFAAKWYGNKKTLFWSKYEHGRETMLAAAYHLVNEADVVVHFNGKRFDMPWLNSEWARMTWTPPAPYTEVDLCQVVKQKFRFPSNKLDYVCGELLGKKKVKTDFELWLGCLANDPAAWKLMERYNRNDVRLTEELYDRIRAWIPSHPNPSLYAADVDGKAHTCPQCGGVNLTHEGYAYTKVGKYPRYNCKDCGRWSRGRNNVATVNLR